MDSATTPLQSPGFLGALTTVHFAIIALLAVLTIIGIAYGMKLSRRRRQGLRDLEEAGHLEQGDTAPVSDPDAPGEAVVAHTPQPTEQGATGSDAPVVQEPVARELATPVTVPTPAAPPVERASITPAPAPAPVAVAPVVSGASDTDLTRLKGLGPKVAAMLVEQGIPDIATLARLDPAQAEGVAAQLGTFAPRMARDRWIEQAQLLAAGDIAGFEAKFGKL